MTRDEAINRTAANLIRSIALSEEVDRIYNRVEVIKRERERIARELAADRRVIHGVQGYGA